MIKKFFFYNISLKYLIILLEFRYFFIFTIIFKNYSFNSTKILLLIIITYEVNKEKWNKETTEETKL